MNQQNKNKQSLFAMEIHGIGLGNFVAHFVYPTFPMSFGYDTMTIGKPLPLGLLGAYKISSVINRHVGNIRPRGVARGSSN